MTSMENCSADQQAAAVTASPSPPHVTSPHFSTLERSADQAVKLLIGIQCKLTKLFPLRKGSHTQFMLFPSKEFNVNQWPLSHINLHFPLPTAEAYPTFETYFWRSMRRQMCRGFAASCSSHATALTQAGSAGTTPHCPGFKELKTNSSATQAAPPTGTLKTRARHGKGSQHHTS